MNNVTINSWRYELFYRLGQNVFTSATICCDKMSTHQHSTKVLSVRHASVADNNPRLPLTVYERRIRAGASAIDTKIAPRGLTLLIRSLGDKANLRKIVTLKKFAWIQILASFIHCLAKEKLSIGKIVPNTPPTYLRGRLCTTPR